MQDHTCNKEIHGENEDQCGSVFCKLPRFDWYWGNISRLEVEYQLLKYPRHFIIRASNHNDYLLCVSFYAEPRLGLKTTRSFCHINLKHHKGLFSLDRKEYVPVEDIPDHCERVGNQMKLFEATALKQNEDTVIEISKLFCREKQTK